MISSTEAVVGTINEDAVDEQWQEAEVAEADECAAAEPEETKESAEARHYAEICDLTNEVQDALYEWQQAKDRASAYKKDYDRLTEKLLRVISHGPDRQKRLFNDKPADQAAVDAFRSHNVIELGLTKSLTEGLEGLGLTTLGELQDYWKAGKHLHDEKNWGPEKAAKVSDAFADLGVNHPELFGQQPTDTDEPGDAEESDDQGE